MTAASKKDFGNHGTQLVELHLHDVIQRVCHAPGLQGQQLRGTDIAVQPAALQNLQSLASSPNQIKIGDAN